MRTEGREYAIVIKRVDNLTTMNFGRLSSNTMPCYGQEWEYSWIKALLDDGYTLVCISYLCCSRIWI